MLTVILMTLSPKMNTGAMNWTNRFAAFMYLISSTKPGTITALLGTNLKFAPVMAQSHPISYRNKEGYFLKLKFDIQVDVLKELTDAVIVELNHRSIELYNEMVCPYSSEELMDRLYLDDEKVLSVLKSGRVEEAAFFNTKKIPTDKYFENIIVTPRIDRISLLDGGDVIKLHMNYDKDYTIVEGADDGLDVDEDEGASTTMQMNAGEPFENMVFDNDVKGVSPTCNDPFENMVFGNDVSGISASKSDGGGVNKAVVDPFNGMFF